jgi:homoserine O-acetyltransferase/O-succinyltransferase
VTIVRILEREATMLRNPRVLACVLSLNLFSPAAAPAQGSPKVTSLGSCGLLSGEQIPNCRIAYRTFGKLGPGRNNVILIPTWLLGRSEDWVPLLGADGIVDTAKYYVIVVDAFANGQSSSPSNTPAPARQRFDRLTIGDMVVAQRRLLREHLDIEHLHAVLGYSMGGMQAFEWAVRYPAEMDRAIPIAGSPRVGNFDRLMWGRYLDAIETGRQARLNPEQIWRRIILLDALFTKTPTALNQENWDSLEARLRIDTRTLTKTWQLDDLAAQLKAIQRYDVSAQPADSLSVAASKVRAQMLIISSPQDHIVTPDAGRAFARLVKADTLSLPSDCGHVVLWCQRPAVAEAIGRFLGR